MSDQGREAGKAINEDRRALAEQVVERQYRLEPGLRDRFGAAGRAKCVQDNEYHLSYLATAITYSSPALFCDYMAWAKRLLASYRVNSEIVQQNLACMRDVLLEALPSEPGKLAATYVEAAIESLPEAPSELPSVLVGDDALSDLAREYLETLLASKRQEASRLILEAVGRGVAVADIYLQVFQRCQREVGRLWQANKISVAQEHYCTAATQLAMSQLYDHLFALPKRGYKMVAASVASETHEVGLRIVADLFEADGWDTHYLGANLPDQSVLQTIEQQQPDILILSATMAFHLPEVEQLIARIRSLESDKPCKIMVGGRPFNIDPELWRRVGADGHGRDASEALLVARRLLQLDEPPHPVGQTIYQRELLADLVGGKNVATPRSEAASYSELGRLNDELLTMQRELARKNAELARLNERLTEADQRKDEFLAMLAHELRNPLAPLRSAAHLLQQPGMEGPLVERTGAIMGRQVQQLGRLVDDLLDLSRIAQGKMHLRQEWVDLGEAVERAADACRPLIESQGHELTVSLPEAPVRLYADPTRLEQVLTNLLNNAARYTPNGGRIWLTASHADGEAVVSVRDSGIGIPPEMLSRIFGLFSQAERAQERAGGGLGIGLSLVKSLMEMHGGSVEAQSDGPDQGSEFTVRWPISVPTAPADATAEEGRAAIDQPRHVLVVDDNADAAGSLAMLLRLWGHEATIAHDGPTALEAVESRVPDIALLDIGLPGMDGYTLARRLRTHLPARRTVLVAVTGWGQDEDRAQTREAGFDHHLVKPVELSTLQQLLALTESDEPNRT